ncbi:hypothetical protein [Billgrantia kenyensis]|uniref:Uncharacterized protein n=1 Tax=Billgrantia kenyensis TaxID=321266 RepID=A0A7V9W0X0_9GAMM|nr:hypothetical protein [Halomonas kenyensis]MBA2778967.1 hypothetical protein [Halomonas kenyensis]MCG6662894.1 hypothetical protein [Halomonas kenyensis]
MARLYHLETFIIFAGAFCLLLGVALLVPAAIISLFKIVEADRHFGVGRFGGERLILKGLPFSLGRMTEYGLLMLFSKTQFVKRRYASELNQIAKNAPPRRFVHLLVWLYSSWILFTLAFMLLGGALYLFY